MSKIRYWRPKTAGMPEDKDINFYEKNSDYASVFWLVVLVVFLLSSAFLYRQNINSLYNLPGSPWSEPVYWQEHISRLRLEAVFRSGGWKRAALFVLSGERLGAPQVGEFTQFRPFETKDSEFYHFYTHRGSSWLNNFIVTPCTMLVGRRLTNTLLIWGSLLSNAVSMAYFLKMLGRSQLGAILGTLLLVFNPFYLTALATLNWPLVYLAWFIIGLALIVKDYRGERNSTLSICATLIMTAFFCGWFTFILLGLLMIFKLFLNSTSFRCSAAIIVSICVAIYLASASLSLELQWLVQNRLIQLYYWGIMAILGLAGISYADLFSKREWLGGFVSFISIGVLWLLGTYGILLGGLMLTFIGSVFLSLLPERLCRQNKYVGPTVSVIILSVCIIFAEWSGLSPLPGLNSNIAPSYFLLSYLTKNEKTVLELPFCQQPLYLFAQAEHGLALASERQLRPTRSSQGYRLLYNFLEQLDHNGVSQSSAYKKLVANNSLKKEAWSELKRQGIDYIVLHERGCNWVELQRGAVSGSTYAQDYLALRKICGEPVLDDYEPLSKGRWGWPAQDERDIAWYRMAVFPIPQDQVDDRKN